MMLSIPIGIDLRVHNQRAPVKVDYTRYESPSWARKARLETIRLAAKLKEFNR